MGAGTASSFKYLNEATWGTLGTPANAQYVRKLPAASVGLERTQIKTQELNSRRAVTAVRLGVKKPRVSIPFELFYGGDAKQFDDFLQSWMGNTWTAAPAAIANQTVTVGTPAATTVFTAGTSIGTIAQGDWVKVTGYTGAQIANNGIYRVASVAALALTLVTPNFATLVAGAAQGTAVALQRMAYISPGITLKSITFEEGQTDLSASNFYKLVKGAVANNLSLTVTPDQIVTGSFDFIAKEFASSTTETLTGVVAAPTTNPMTANDSLTYLMVDNAAVAVVSNLTLNGTNGLEDQFPVGSTTPYNIGMGISDLSGTMDIYLTNVDYWTKYQAETPVSLTIRLMDPDTATPGQGYAIDIPNIKIGNLSETKSQTNVIQSVSWMAIEKATAGTSGAATVNMRISRLV